MVKERDALELPIPKRGPPKLSPIKDDENLNNALKKYFGNDNTYSLFEEEEEEEEEDDEFVPSTPLTDDEGLDSHGGDFNKEIEALQEDIRPKFDRKVWEDFINEFQNDKQEPEDDRSDLNYIPYDEIYGEESDEEDDEHLETDIETEHDQSQGTVVPDEVSQFVEQTMIKRGITQLLPKLENIHLSVAPKESLKKMMNINFMNQYIRQLQNFLQLCLQNQVFLKRSNLPIEKQRTIFQRTANIIKKFEQWNLQAIHGTKVLSHNRDLVRGKPSILKSDLMKLETLKEVRRTTLIKSYRENRGKPPAHQIESIIERLPMRLLETHLKFCSFEALNPTSFKPTFYMLMPFTIMENWNPELLPRRKEQYDRIFKTPLFSKAEDELLVMGIGMLGFSKKNLDIFAKQIVPSKDRFAILSRINECKLVKPFTSNIIYEALIRDKYSHLPIPPPQLLFESFLDYCGDYNEMKKYVFPTLPIDCLKAFMNIYSATAPKNLRNRLIFAHRRVKQWDMESYATQAFKTYNLDEILD